MPNDALNLILPPDKQDGDLTFSVDGHTADRNAALAAIHKGLAHARSPAIAGVEHLTLEGLRAAVRLAQAHQAKLLLGGSNRSGIEATPTAAQQATIGHLFQCELIIWVGCKGTTSAITEAIAARQLRGAFVEPTLATVRQLRARHRQDPMTAPIGQYKQVGVVLDADCEARVASQWHAFAQEMQEHVRLAVLQLPAASAANRRGAIDAVLWLTGHDLATAGLDFASDPARRCPHLTTLLERQAVDWVLSFGQIIEAHVAHVAVTGALLRRGTHGRVTRCDGLIQALDDDAAEVQEDVTAALLAAAVTGRG